MYSRMENLEKIFGCGGTIELVLVNAGKKEGQWTKDGLRQSSCK